MLLVKSSDFAEIFSVSMMEAPLYAVTPVILLVSSNDVPLNVFTFVRFRSVVISTPFPNISAPLCIVNLSSVSSDFMYHVLTVFFSIMDF